MISFIVIGLNEGWKLNKCFRSVYETTVSNRLPVYEIIYVDSKSMDDSISRALQFEDVKVFQITGKCNSAIARNIGAAEAQGNILFFIDGDMEINPGFLNAALDNKHQLTHPYISGQLIHRKFNSSNEYIGEEKAFKNLVNDRIEKTTGGVFLVDRKYWDNVNGMKSKYHKSQDLDFGLRLARDQHVYLLRKQQLIAFHNTIAYHDKKRILTDIHHFRKLLFKGVLLRDHLLNKHLYRRLVRMDFTLLIFLFSIITTVFWNYAFLIYVVIITARAGLNLLLKKKNMMALIMNYLSRDIGSVIGFLFFFPSNLSQQYKSVLRR